MSTGRLILPLPADTDLVADGQSHIVTLSTVLDNAACWRQGRKDNMPDPVSHVVGTFLWTTDTDELYVCAPSHVGNIWAEVGMGGALSAWFEATFDVDGHIVGEVITMAGNPGANYIFCDGSTHNIADYPELYSVIGTSFGGNGINTFGVPKLTTSAVGGPGVEAGIWYFIKAISAPVTVIVP